MFEKMTFEQMDEAAKQAEEDLKNFDQKAVEIVANWWNKWYLKAGHKRLGRMLVKKFKDKEKTESLKI
jgi:hypothetical protein